MKLSTDFHPVLPTFLPPPIIPLESTTTADSISLSNLRLSTLGQVIDTVKYLFF